MKAEYDKETDTLTITLRDARVKGSDEIRPGVIADFGYDGAWLASKLCKPQKWSKKRAKCSSQSLITDTWTSPCLRLSTIGVRLRKGAWPRKTNLRGSTFSTITIQLLSLRLLIRKVSARLEMKVKITKTK